MKTKATFYLIFLLATFSIGTFAQSNNYLQLCNLNKEWNNIAVDSELKQNRVFNSEAAIITYHLQQVETRLKAKDVSHLPEKVQQCREEGLAVLNQYWQRGLYPKNNSFDYRIPFFIDDANTACAVGYIMQGTGNEDLADYISATQNNAYVRNMKGEAIFSWANEYGFTIDELAWIQPSYGPCWNGQPYEMNKVQPTCGNSDGSFEVFVNAATSYEWDNGATGLQFDNLPAGVYTMRGTYNNICPFELNVILENESGADVSVSSLSPQTCQGINDGSLQAVINSVNGTYNLSWSNGSNNMVASNLESGNHFVTVIDQADCVSIERGWVSISNSMYVFETVFGSSCNNNTGAIDLGVYGGNGTGAFAYQWSNGNSSEDPSNLSSGDYSVLINDDAGCFMTHELTVYDDCDGKITCSDDNADINNTYGGYIFPFANDTDASDANFTQITISQPTYGSAYSSNYGFMYSYLPSENTFIEYYPNDNTYTGPDSFTYKVCTSYGFCDSATVYINLVAVPVVQVATWSDEDLKLCNGESVYLTATGAESYSWSPANGLSTTTGNSVQASPSQTTTYTITGTNADGSTDNTQITIEVGAAVATISGLPYFAEIDNGGISLYANPPGGTFSGNGIIFNAFNPAITGAGVHTVNYEVTDEATGCVATASQIILVYSVTYNFVNYYLGTINPKIGELIIETNAAEPGTYEFLIADITGRVVASDNLQIEQKIQQHKIETSNLPAGLYIATLKSKSQTYSKQFVLGS